MTARDRRVSVLDMKAVLMPDGREVVGKEGDSDSPQREPSSTISARKTVGLPTTPHSAPPLPAFMDHFLSPRLERERGGGRDSSLGSASLSSQQGRPGRKSGHFHLPKLTSDWGLKQSGPPASTVFVNSDIRRKKKKKQESLFAGEIL